MAIYRTYSDQDIRALQFVRNDNGTTTVQIKNYGGDLFAERTVTSASLNWVVKDMAYESILLAKNLGVKYNEVNRVYAAVGIGRRR